MYREEEREERKTQQKRGKKSKAKKNPQPYLFNDNVVLRV